jgi:peptidylprolyl isomerase
MLFLKRSIHSAACACLLFTAAVAAEPAPKAPEEIDIQKVSAAFGHFIGKNLKSSGLNFDTQNFIQGIRDGLEGKPAPLSDKEYERQMMLLQEQTFKKLAEENIQKAEAFLKKNAKEPGVIEIEPEKLQYIIKKAGTGEVVKDKSAPQIQYTGKYLDGTLFGSSQDTGGPITVHLDQTISGFSDGLKGMKEGELRTIYVHPDLGYGKSGNLPPNSLLIFEVELLKADNPEKDEDINLAMPGDEEDMDEEMDEPLPIHQ